MGGEMGAFTTTRRGALAGALSLAAAGVAGGSEPMSGNQTAWQGKSFRRYEIGTQQGLESLQLVNASASEPADGEALIAMRAAALNHRDLLIMASTYGQPKPPARVPLSDGAGEVVAIGPGVTSVKPGDRVTAPHFTSWLDGDYDPAIFVADLGNSKDGWLTELALMPAAALVKLPDSMKYEDAAAWGAAGITAWTVLDTLGDIKAGDMVLTLGTGGVSILALQIAKMNGASVAITSSSDAKLAVARELGADITVNYRTEPDWAASVRAATGGRGVDIVVETVGLSTLPQSLSCCAPNARVGLLGALGGRPNEPTDLSKLIFGNIVLKGITSGSRKMFADLLRACDANSIRPRIDRVFPFDEARAAYDYLAGAGHIGKVVITNRP
jgi:NADPH:quinone reductase-like Zn-dependent oxidoreductase